MRKSKTIQSFYAIVIGIKGQRKGQRKGTHKAYVPYHSIGAKINGLAAYDTLKKAQDQLNDSIYFDDNGRDIGIVKVQIPINSRTWWK
jgi:hypothetical protein